jgi:hypothetical protein
MRAQIALLHAKSSARSPLVRGHYSEGVGTPLEQAAGEITACDLHVLITGEEAALPFQTALVTMQSSVSPGRKPMAA